MTLTSEDNVDPESFSLMAATMARDEQITIFRRFDKLNILNLLMLQDEIQKMSKSFELMCGREHDNTDGIPRGYLASYILGRVPQHDHEATREDETAAERRAAERTTKWEALQRKLKEYSMSLNF